MHKIILDTNFLMIPTQFKLDIYSELDKVVPGIFKLYTLDVCIRELNKIIKQGGKKKEQASLALQLLKHHDVITIKSSVSYADKELINRAKKDYIIATQDSGLKRRLRQIKAKIVTMRNKSYLVLE